MGLRIVDPVIVRLRPRLDGATEKLISVARTVFLSNLESQNGQCVTRLVPESSLSKHSAI